MHNQSPLLGCHISLMLEILIAIMQHLRISFVVAISALFKLEGMNDDLSQ